VTGRAASLARPWPSVESLRALHHDPVWPCPAGRRVGGGHC